MQIINDIDNSNGFRGYNPPFPPRRCDSCKHFSYSEDKGEGCTRPEVTDRSLSKHIELVDLDSARAICDKEWTGHFIYYERMCDTSRADVFLGLLCAFGFGMLFSLPWLFTNEEIYANTRVFWATVFGG